MWCDLYGLIATTCGYSYPVIDAMTLFEVEELTRYWTSHPPLHLLIAAFLGWQHGKSGGEKRPTAAAPKRDMAAEQLLANLGPGIVNGDVHAGLGKVLLDSTELRRKAAAESRRPKTPP
jgi:hypothetical protein